MSTSDGSPSFVVVEASLNPAAIEVGESTTVSATVENVGDAFGRTSAKLYVDGSYTGDSRIVRLYPGESEQVTFTKAFQDAGEYEIKVDEEPAGTLSVTEPTPEPAGSTDSVDQTETPPTQTADATPGSPVVDADGSPVTDSPVRLIAGGQLWGLLVLLLVLAAALGIAGYRQYAQ